MKIREAIIISLIQHFKADFLWKVSLKILNSGIILKTYGMNGLHYMGRSAWVGYHLKNAGHEWATIYA